MIEIYYTQQFETAENHESIAASNRIIQDAAFNFQNIYLKGIADEFKLGKDTIKIVLNFNENNEIIWAFQTDPSDEIKEAIRNRLKKFSTAT